MKPAVEENEGQAQEPEPQVATHPRLRAADAPYGDALAGAKENRKNHEAKADDAKEEPERAATPRTSQRLAHREHVNRCGGRQNDKRRDRPPALCFIDTHDAAPMRSTSEKLSSQYAVPTFLKNTFSDQRDALRRAGMRRRNWVPSSLCRDRTRSLSVL